MPHLRPRHLEALLRKSLKFSPITGVFGHRQVGKTTLVNQLAEKYVSLDRREILESAQADPEAMLAENKASPFVLDECQLAPALFPAMKEWVRVHPKPGQLLLTGSVRFSSRKAIRESLTGRIISWELLPLDLSETHEAALPETLLRILKAKTVEIELRAPKYYSESSIARYLTNGGLPGVFAVREAAIREQRFETQIETILERDLRLLVQTTLSYRSLRELLHQLAEIQGQPFEWASLSRKTRISAPALRKLIAAFESLFLIRLIPTRGTEKKPVLFFEDQGEASHLRKGRTEAVGDLVRFLFSQLRTQHSYRPDEKVQMFQYRNRGGALLPLCYESPSGRAGFLPSLSETPDAQSLASARSFLRAYSDAKVYIFHGGTKDTIVSNRIRALGLGQLV